MSFKHLIFHLVGMALAYICMLIVPIFVDFNYQTHTEIYVIAWLTVGLLVMQIKVISYPKPAVDPIDVMGGLMVLWWALFWPRYLHRVK